MSHIVNHLQHTFSRKFERCRNPADEHSKMETKLSDTRALEAIPDDDLKPALKSHGRADEDMTEKSSMVTNSICMQQSFKRFYESLVSHSLYLTLKAPITTAADDIHKYFFIVFSEKIRLGVSSESSARQRIHMKNQALFSSKDKSKKIKVSSAAIFVLKLLGWMPPSSWLAVHYCFAWQNYYIYLYLRFVRDIDVFAEEEQKKEALVESLDKTCTRYNIGLY